MVPCTLVGQNLTLPFYQLMRKNGLVAVKHVPWVRNPETELGNRVCVNLRDPDLHVFCKEVWNFTYDPRQLMRVLGIPDISMAKREFPNLSPEQYAQIGLRLEKVYPVKRGKFLSGVRQMFHEEHVL